MSYFLFLQFVFHVAQSVFDFFEVVVDFVKPFNQDFGVTLLKKVSDERVHSQHGG
jgi:hypothetical protein